MKNKLIQQYKNLSFKVFMVNMADHLSSEDYRFLDECHSKMLEIEKKLNEQGINIR